MPATILPLVVACPSASPQNQSLIHDANGPILQVQMDTLGGQTYLVTLTVAAAKTLLVVLANWPPAVDSLSGQGLPEPPKLQ